MLNKQETELVGNFILPLNKDGVCQLAPQYVGRPAREIAEKAGVIVPKGHPCILLIGEADQAKISLKYPMCLEKLMPVTAFFRAKDFKEAVEISKTAIHLAGIGHTASIHTAVSA